MSNKIYHSENLSIIYIILDDKNKEFKVRNLASKTFFKENELSLDTEKMRLCDITLALNELIVNEDLQVVNVIDLENHFNLDMKILNKYKNNITSYWISLGWKENNALGEPIVRLNHERAQSLNDRYDNLKKLEEALDAQIARNKRIYVEQEGELKERLEALKAQHEIDVEREIAKIDHDLNLKKKEYEEILTYKDKTIQDIDSELSQRKTYVDNEIYELTEKLNKWKENKRKECETLKTSVIQDIEKTKRKELKSVAEEYIKIEASAKSLIKELIVYESTEKAQDILDTLKNFIKICDTKINDLKNELN